MVIVSICGFTGKVYVDLFVNDGDHSVQEVDTCEISQVNLMFRSQVFR